MSDKNNEKNTTTNGTKIIVQNKKQVWPFVVMTCLALVISVLLGFIAYFFVTRTNNDSSQNGGSNGSTSNVNDQTTTSSSSSSSRPLGQLYVVSYDEVEHGQITGPSYARRGEEFSVTFTPDVGYSLESYTVYGRKYYSNYFESSKTNFKPDFSVSKGGDYTIDGLLQIDGGVIVSATFVANKYTVNLSGTKNGKSFGTRTFTYDSPISLPTSDEDIVGFSIEWQDINNNKYKSNDIWKIAQDNFTLYANWISDSYVIDLNPNGGKFESTNSSNILQTNVYYDSDTNWNFEEPISTTAGFKFKGWYDGYNLIPSTGSHWKYSTSSLELKAEWTEKTFFVKYNLKEGESLENSDNTEITYGEEFKSKLKITKKTGYTFKGWYLSEASRVIGFGDFANDTWIWDSDDNHVFELTATWDNNSLNAYFVENEKEEGTEPSYDRCIEGIKYDQGWSFYTPTKSGYDFQYWYYTYVDDKNVLQEQKVDLTGTKWTYSAGDITLKAKWKESTYKITLNPDGGYVYDKNNNQFTNETVNISVDYLSSWNFGTEAENTLPYKDGYTFDGWYYEETTSEGATKSEKVANSGGSWSLKLDKTKSLTLTAHWTINKYTMTIDDTVTNGQIIVREDNEEGQSIASGSDVEYDKTLYITFTPSAGYKLTSYEIIKTSEDEETKETIQGESDLSKTGAYGVEYKVKSKDFTISAKFSGQDYALTLNLCDGYFGSDASNQEVTVTTGEEYSLSDHNSAVPHQNMIGTPEKDGYSFAGWYTAETGGTLKLGSGTNYKWGTNASDYTASQTWYAHWTAKQYTMTIVTPTNGSIKVQKDNSSGSTITSGTGVDFGTTLYITFTPSAGYKLTSYEIIKTSEDEETKETIQGESDLSKTGAYGVEYKVKSNDFTISAKFSGQDYALTLNLCDGYFGNNTSNQTKTVTSGETYTLSSTHSASPDKLTIGTPERDGYSFAGWYTAETGGTLRLGSGTNYKWGTNASDYTASQTWYAHWTAKQYTMTIVTPTNGSIKVQKDNSSGATITSGTGVDFGTTLYITFTPKNGLYKLASYTIAGKTTTGSWPYGTSVEYTVEKTTTFSISATFEEMTVTTKYTYLNTDLSKYIGTSYIYLKLEYNDAYYCYNVVSSSGSSYTCKLCGNIFNADLGWISSDGNYELTTTGRGQVQGGNFWCLNSNYWGSSISSATNYKTLGGNENNSYGFQCEYHKLNKLES